MRFATLALAVAGLLFASGAASGADAERGKALYEARCDLCHRASVHVREARKASTFGGLRQQVARWNTELRAGWSEGEIDDVTVYLNNRYYRFPCPESVCGAGRADAGPQRTSVLLAR